MDIQKTKLERYDDLLQKFVLWLQRPLITQFPEPEKVALEREKSGKEFIMAYQRASSYASAKVLSAIEEYISWRGTSYEGQPPDVLPSGEEAGKIAKVAREKIDNIFVAIREDIQPTERHFSFHSLTYSEKLR